MLIPLSTGLFIKACFESFATVLHRGAKLVEAASLVALFVVIVVLNIQNLKTLFGTLGIAALLVLLWLAISIGYSLGGPSRNTRKVLALGTGQRNIEAAFLVASQGFENQPMVLVIVIVTALISLISVWPMAFWFGRKDPAENVQ
jgi:BASS family bile acid:Na+ symporter